jgi:hypothetical protein
VADGTRGAAVRDLLERRRTVLALVGAVVAAALAALWLVVVPERVAEVDGLQRAVLRYGHSACWALVALAAVLHGVRAPRRAVAASAYGALGCYAAFLAAVVL